MLQVEQDYLKGILKLRKTTVKQDYFMAAFCTALAVFLALNGGKTFGIIILAVGAVLYLTLAVRGHKRLRKARAALDDSRRCPYCGSDDLCECKRYIFHDLTPMS
jgi:hypothetical protein